MPLAVTARLVGLTLTARRRFVGAVPWIILLAWAIYARAQEPIMLRSFGISLHSQACWVGGCAILLLHLGGPRPPDRRPAVHTTLLANAVVLAVASLAQASLALVCELPLGSVDLERHARSLLLFPIAWAPLATALAWPTSTKATRIALPTFLGLVGAALSVQLWQVGLTASTAAASAAGCAAAVSACPRP
jgi:ABC-type sugar transport system permease subunit